MQTSPLSRKEKARGCASFGKKGARSERFYNLTDPAAPKAAGVIEGARGGVSLEDVFLVSAHELNGLRLHKLNVRAHDLADPVLPNTQPPTPVRAQDTPRDGFFLIDEAPSLDTVCSFRSGGDIVIHLPVSRYVGQVNADSTLRNATTLKENGYISSVATLEIMSYDVDSNGSVTGGTPAEVDVVFFNGRNAGVLTGRHQQWTASTINVPIEWIKFPNKGSTPSTIVPALNEIRIQIDAAWKSVRSILPSKSASEAEVCWG